jgi:hypothetical protein
MWKNKTKPCTASQNRFACGMPLQPTRLCYGLTAAPRRAQSRRHSPPLPSTRTLPSPPRPSVRPSFRSPNHTVVRSPGKTRAFLVWRTRAACPAQPIFLLFTRQDHKLPLTSSLSRRTSSSSVPRCQTPPDPLSYDNDDNLIPAICWERPRKTTKTS